MECVLFPIRILVLYAQRSARWTPTVREPRNVASMDVDTRAKKQVMSNSLSSVFVAKEKGEEVNFLFDVTLMYTNWLIS